MGKVVPVLLSGGAGARLWPLSRASRPKPLLALTGGASALQTTVARVRDAARFAPPIVVAHADHRFQVAEQLRAAGVADATLLLEPVARGTGPAIAAAARVAQARDPDAVLLVLPADHHIDDEAAFLAAVEAGLEVGADRLVLFGVAPDHPATGYGYILPGADGEVARFVEKPDAATAARLIADGALWNGGMFLLPARALLDELATHAPAVLAATSQAVDAAVADADFLRLDAAAFAAAPAISLDHAVLEKTDRAAVVRAAFAWSDLGTWPSLWAAAPHDAAGNALVGDVLALDAEGSYLRSEGPLVAVVGVRDVVVVATPDAVLVAPREAGERVKDVVEALRGRGHPASE